MRLSRVCGRMLGALCVLPALFSGPCWRSAKKDVENKMTNKLTHLDDKGRASMVDVTAKAVTARVATARAVVRMKNETLAMIVDGRHAKGDVLAVARIAGIQGAKRTSDLIPLCHPLMIGSVKVDLAPISAAELEILATVKVSGPTGVEMEALTACSVAALTVYDMCKAVDKGMVIEQIALLAKRGGKSGDYYRAESGAADDATNGAQEA